MHVRHGTNLKDTTGCLPAQSLVGLVDMLPAHISCHVPQLIKYECSLQQHQPPLPPLPCINGMGTCMPARCEELRQLSVAVACMLGFMPACVACSN